MIRATGRRLLLRLLITGLASGLVLTARPPAAAAQALPRVRLVATGGTIANRAGARLSPAELVRLAPAIDRHARIDVEAFTNVSSGQLTLEQWLLSIGVALTIVPVSEVRKLILRRKPEPAQVEEEAPEAAGALGAPSGA